MNWNEVYDRGVEKVNYTCNKLNGLFPHITEKGKWLTAKEGHWTGGFWTGLLWMGALYPQRDEGRIRTALAQAEKLRGRMKDNKTHDMGFIFGPGCVFGAAITGNDDLTAMAEKGAHNLLHLYDPKSEVIYAWDEPGYEGVAIVDTIMNLPILKWTADRSDDKYLGEMATKVADQIAGNHIRKDFSTFHVVRWDTNTHQVAERTTHQGFSADSCWSRGQAWALYGFANMYRYTSKESYLEYARHLAEYFWSHTDSQLHLPRWDFIFQHNQNEPLDAAAAAIAASGMLLIAEILERRGDAASVKWKERATVILESLVKNCFYDSLDEFGIIKQVTVDRPRNSGVNESSMYGDYYFMEAVFRLLYAEDAEMLAKLY